jgi:hypothetical protein
MNEDGIIRSNKLESHLSLLFVSLPEHSPEILYTVGT